MRDVAPISPTRRRLVKLLATALCLGACRRQPVYLGVTPAARDDEYLHRLLTAFFDDPRAATAVGRHCIARFPVLADGAIERTHALLTATESLRTRFSRQCRADFARGDTVILDGWLCARCEADLCTAYALLTCA